MTLPSGYADLVPHPAGLVVEEVRRLPGDASWIAILWRGQSVAGAAEAYRAGLVEKGWKVLTPGTARVHAQALARLGLATDGDAEQVVVGKKRGQSVAVLLNRGGGDGSARVEVTLEGALAPRAPGSLTPPRPRP